MKKKLFFKIAILLYMHWRYDKLIKHLFMALTVFLSEINMLEVIPIFTVQEED